MSAMQTVPPIPTMTLVTCFNEPLVPVTFAVKVPRVEPETVSVDVAVPYADNATLVGLTDAVRPGAAVVRDTVPAKPKRLVIVMVEVPEPGVMENVVGFAEREKFGGGIVIDMVTNSDSCFPLIIVVAFTVTVYLPGGVEAPAVTVSVEVAKE